MIALVFDQTKLPRTMTRTEWLSVHRWKREMQTKLREYAAREIETLRRAIVEASIFGSSVIGIERGLDEITNPRLLIGPYHDTLRDFDIRSGAVNRA